MTVSRLIFKLLYPFCCSDTKIILGNMDTKAEIIQRCVDDKLKDDIARTCDFNSEAPPPDDFEKWVNILEAGTFNPVERIAIKAALYSHRREATRKIIYSTLVDGEVVATFKDSSSWKEESSAQRQTEIEKIINDFGKDFGEENQCK